MHEDSYLDTYWEDRYDSEHEHDGLDPYWEGHWNDGEYDDEPDAPENDFHDDYREDFGWFGEMGLND